MPSVGLIACSLLVCGGPIAMVLVMLLFRHPHLFLVSMLSSGAWCFGPTLASSLAHAIFGGSDGRGSGDAPEVWLLCVVAALSGEAVRCFLARKVLQAEQQFCIKGQSLVVRRSPTSDDTSSSSPSSWLTPFAIAIGAGCAAMHTVLTAGAVANAEVMLTFVVSGTSWMNPESSLFTWYDVEACASFPKVFWVAIQALFFFVCHLAWSFMAVGGAVLVSASHTRTATTRASRPTREHRQRLVNNADVANEDVELTDTTSATSDHHEREVGAAAAVGVPSRSSSWATPRAEVRLWFCTALPFLLHLAFRLSSMITVTHPSMRYDDETSTWAAASSSGGCGASLGLEAAITVFSVIVAAIVAKDSVISQSVPTVRVALSSPLSQRSN